MQEQVTATVSRLTTLTKAPNLRETVAQELRAAIISGEMEPGGVYSAPSLGARFGVSATPVREAMLDLAREGLVVALPNKGFRVQEVSDQDLDDIAEVRLLIEPTTVRSVVGRIPAADLPRLRRMAQRIVDAAAVGDLIGYTEADRRFHLAVLEYSGNRRLVEIVAELRSQSRLLGLSRMLESGRLVSAADEHIELVDLIAAGDAAGAEALMHAHILHVRSDWAGPRHPGAR